MTVKEIEIQLALGSLPYNIKRELATDKRTSKKMLSKLSADEHWRIRSKVASNPNTPVEVLTELAKKNDYYHIKYSVANNPSTPKEVLEILFADKDYVKWRVEYTNTPGEVLKGNRLLTVKELKE